MADEERDKQLDQVLDSVLAQYSAVEPRPGLEARILTRIADVRSRRKGLTLWRLRWLWTGAAAAALAAIVLIGFFLRPATWIQQMPDTTQTQPQPVVAAPVPQVLQEHNQPGPMKIRQRRSTTVRPVRTVEVRQEVFPTPVPLSEQEILLLQYLSRTPRQELLAQSHPDPSPEDGDLEGGTRLFPGITNQRSSNQ